MLSVLAKRLCLMSSVFYNFELIPCEVLLDHDVEVGQQLAHAGGDHQLLGLGIVPQPLGKGLDDLVEPHRGNSSHVQDTTNSGPSAADTAFAFELSGVAVVGRHSGQ